MKQTLLSLLVMLLPLMANAQAVEIDGIYYDLFAKQAEVTFCSNGYTGNVVIPSSVVFYDVTYTVTSIGNEAFNNCYCLNSVTIPNSVKSIGDNAFDYCSGLTSITIPNSVTSIGRHAFWGCSGLTSITIPNSVTSIGLGAFGGCSGLTSVVVESGNAFYDSRNNCNAIIQTESNTLIGGCYKTLIPNSVTSIGEYAFYECSGLTSITISNSVTSIGLRAFAGCSGLTSIVVESGNAVYDSRNNCNAIIQTESNTLIGGCYKTLIPNSVTSIGNYAFEGCSGLTFVTIPNTVTSIGNDAFSGCSGLTSVTIPNSVTSIEYNAFRDCSGLTSVTIPNSVTSIGNYAFEGCSGLTSITIPNSVTSIGYDAFSGCSGLTSVTIPNSVTSIEYNAFYGCSGLTTVTIPNSVTTIRAAAFRGCSSLTSVTIPNSVMSIGNYAFEGCSGLTSVTIPNSVTSIGNYAFEGCSDLTSVTIPNSVTSIGGGTFKGCSGLTSITIPTSVTFIGQETFAGCSHLTDVYCYATTVPSTSKDAFNDSYFRYATLHIPASAIYDYKSKEPWSLFKEVVAIESQKYSLKYMVDGTLYKEFSMEEGAAITPEPAPKKDGYTFSGWSAIPATMPANDVTVTGTFTKNAPITYTLTYLVDGVVYKTFNYEAGATVARVEAPTKEGYTFSGWSNTLLTMPARNVTITGTFTKNAPTTYKLTYMVDGKEYKSVSYTAGAVITAEPAPTKQGYEFSGWTNLPKTMPERDVTVTGTFTQKAYNNEDVAVVLALILSGNPTAEEMARYDMNHDGELNIGDIILIKRAILENKLNGK